MRTLAATRLSVSLLCAVLVHGVVFGVAAVVLSRETSEGPAQPTALDVEVVAPKSDPAVAAAPGPALIPAKLAVPAPAHHRSHETAPPRELTLESRPGIDDPSTVAVPGTPTAVPAPVPAAAPSRGPGVSRLGAGVVVPAEPRYRDNPTPEYPLPSKRRREEGVVLLSVVIEPDGSVARVSLKLTSGHPLLDEAALDVVRHRWTFEPARAAGVPIESTRDVPIRFSLSD
jgi:periplasmic protein TonB